MRRIALIDIRHAGADIDPIGDKLDAPHLLIELEVDEDIGDRNGLRPVLQVHVSGDFCIGHGGVAT